MPCGFPSARRLLLDCHNTYTHTLLLTPTITTTTITNTTTNRNFARVGSIQFYPNHFKPILYIFAQGFIDISQSKQTFSSFCGSSQTPRRVWSNFDLIYSVQAIPYCIEHIQKYILYSFCSDRTVVFLNNF